MIEFSLSLGKTLEVLLPFTVALIIALLFAKLIIASLKIFTRRISSKTKTILDDLLFESLDLPITLWVTGISIYIAAVLTSVSDFPLTNLFVREFVIAVGAYTVYKVLNAVLHWYTVEVAPTHNIQLGGLENTIRRIGALFIFALALIMMLDAAGIEVSPLLASLGIAGLAVALAFQDTLGNFFAGVHISIDRPIKEGDYVLLDSGQEGYVVKIGWRTTQIKQRANNIITIPNSKLASSIITNFYSPDKSTVIPVPVSVSYDSDLKKVEKITLEVANHVLKTVPGGVKNYEPKVRFTAFGDSGISFSVFLKVEDYPERLLVVHEFIKQLHERFRKEGIEIPYPKRDIYIKGEFSKRKQ
ncbi:MAG: mechanosensitive ion channel family protein [Candidatus Anstonellaceae archaeon]